LSNMSSSFFTDGNAFPSWEAQVSSIFHSGHIWFPLDTGPFPFSPPPRKQELSCHCCWWLTHLDPHRMNAVQDLLLMACQGDPYSQEVPMREKATKEVTSQIKTHH
jgi:hypothetical protein